MLVGSWVGSVKIQKVHPKGSCSFDMDLNQHPLDEIDTKIKSWN